MVATILERVKKNRLAMRAAGLRPMQIWVPDTSRPNFADECKRQSLLAAKADEKDIEMDDFMEDALSDVEGWSA